MKGSAINLTGTKEKINLKGIKGKLVFKRRVPKMALLGRQKAYEMNEIRGQYIQRTY